MEHIELNDHTHRLRRNLMGSAFLIMVIVFSGIKVTNATGLVVTLEGLTTDHILFALLVLMLYHAVAFFVMAKEDYKIWEMEHYRNYSHKQACDRRIFEAENTLVEAKIIAEEAHRPDEFIKDLTDVTNTQIARLRSFPHAVKKRFWRWDIGVAAATTFIATCAGIYGLCAT